MNWNEFTINFSDGFDGLVHMEYPLVASHNFDHTASPDMIFNAGHFQMSRVGGCLLIYRLFLPPTRAFQAECLVDSPSVSFHVCGLATPLLSLMSL